MRSEFKRKIFHYLALVYMGLYAFLPRSLVLGFLSLAFLLASGVEFLRLRRPEINALLLNKFGGIHRPEEIMAPSGIFWTLAGSWLTMLVFTNRRIVLAAMGFLVFGDAAAALCGQRWGRRRWPKNPLKTYEGSFAFAGISAAWAMLFLRWPVALLSAAAGAAIEALPLPWNDNFWIPLLSGLALSLFNLLLGRYSIA